MLCNLFTFQHMTQCTCKTSTGNLFPNDIHVYIVPSATFLSSLCWSSRLTFGIGACITISSLLFSGFCQYKVYIETRNKYYEHHCEVFYSLTLFFLMLTVVAKCHLMTIFNDILLYMCYGINYMYIHFTSTFSTFSVVLVFFFINLSFFSNC